MPPSLLFDLSEIDLTQVAYNKTDISEVNPQSYEMSQLDALIWADREKLLFLGYKDVTEDEFWIRLI